MLTIAALLIAAFAVPQDPPAPDQPPLQPGAEAPAVSPEVLAAIEKVSGSYDSADRDVRSAAEAGAAGRPEQLLAAEAALDRLVEDMESLLKLLPG